MQRTHTENKTYVYPTTNIGLDDDVAAVLKRLAKQRRLPTYRLASEVLRKWCSRQEKKEAHDQQSQTRPKSAIDGGREAQGGTMREQRDSTTATSPPQPQAVAGMTPPFIEIPDKGIGRPTT